MKFRTMEPGQESVGIKNRMPCCAIVQNRNTVLKIHFQNISNFLATIVSIPLLCIWSCGDSKSKRLLNNYFHAPVNTFHAPLKSMLRLMIPENCAENPSPSLPFCEQPSLHYTCRTTLAHILQIHTHILSIQISSSGHQLCQCFKILTYTEV